jgi:hypothetical protein
VIGSLAAAASSTDGGAAAWAASTGCVDVKPAGMAAAAIPVWLAGITVATIATTNTNDTPRSQLRKLIMRHLRYTDM